MAEIITINSMPTERVYLEAEKPNTDKKNILFLLLMLMARGVDMVDDTVDASIAQIEALRSRYDAKQEKIQNLLDQLKAVSQELDYLKSLESADLDKLKAAKKKLEKLQIGYQKEMVEAGKLQNDMKRVVQVEVAPIMQMLEVFSNVGKGMIHSIESLYGNDLKLK
ncbi:MAG: hypothetical protein COT84_00470 [Chlamydiae bacterium CG10_big_fil_rev_8_21_14_0_10_35_9]|nr:MAG: hypothetical protein COT84_00470 [Chlamydiae bacterium CG10_big_fil_rev_8_21_14_0_10_35_9]